MNYNKINNGYKNIGLLRDLSMTNDFLPEYVQPKYATEMVTINSERFNRLIINAISDTFIIKYIMIPKHINLNDIESLTISNVNMNEEILLTIPFNLLLSLSTIEYCDGYKCIILHKDLINSFIVYNKNTYENIFKDQIPSEFLDNNFVRGLCLTLNSKTNFDFKITIMLFFYTKEHRENLSINTHSTIINTYDEASIISQYIFLNYSHPLCGIFIETRDKLDEFTLKLGRHIRSNYDKILIKLNRNLIYQSWTIDHTKTLYSVLRSYLPDELIYIINKNCQINNYYLYWFPLDDNPLSYKTNFNTYLNTRFLLDKGGIEINIKTENNIYDGKIYAKLFRILSNGKYL